MLTVFTAAATESSCGVLGSATTHDVFVCDGEAASQATITTSTSPLVHLLNDCSKYIHPRSIQLRNKATMCGADCFLMLLSVLFPPIGGK